MAEKTYSPKEAALAVLKKAQELYGNTTLAKAEHKAKKPLKKDGMGATPPPMPAGQGATLGGIINYPGADKTAPLGKSDEQGQNPDAAADAKLGEQVEQDVHEHEEKNADPAHAEMPMKGHIKLAKFMGRMEHKKEMKSKEMDKTEGSGVGHAPDSRSPGTSEAGIHLRSGNPSANSAKPTQENVANAKHYQKQTLGEMQSMPKPKLPG